MATTAAAQVADYPPSWDEVPVAAGTSRWQRGQKQTHAAKTVTMRERLREVMGGRCKECGGSEGLEFHHPRGRNWVARKKNQLTRMRLYLQDFLLGNLELLCSGCNKSAGMPLGFWQRAKARKARRRRRSR